MGDLWRLPLLPPLPPRLAHRRQLDFLRVLEIGQGKTEINLDEDLQRPAHEELVLFNL